MTQLKTAKKIWRAGIVGCGRIASSFDKDPRRKYVATHAGAYQAVPSVKLVSACDLDDQKLQEFGSRWKVKNLYRDFKEMLAVEKLDIVSICTWQASHFELAKQAVKAGIKAIFCEKPVTEKLSDADALVELCEREGVALAVNHSRRWDDAHNQIKKFLDSGKIGKIRHVNAYYTAGVANTGTHLFDLLRLFLGDAEWVNTSPAPVFGDKDLTMSGQVYFKNGTLATLVGLDVKDYLIFEMDFYGSKGRLRITHSGFELAYWKVGESPYFSGYKELKSSKAPFALKEKKMMVNAVSDLVHSMKTGSVPKSTGTDGLKALELICAFKLSFEKGARVTLPLQNREIKL